MIIYRTYASSLFSCVILLVVLSGSLLDAATTNEQQQQTSRAWLARRALQSRAQPQSGVTGSALEVSPPPASPAIPAQQPVAVASNRSARTADVFQGGEGYNIFVTNTCERESMRVNIKTSRPFFGVIHTRSQRQKAVCTVEGNGDSDYSLDISHVLNTQDPGYCGVIKARKESPEDKDILSVVVAVRVHRNIELSDDKFFLLNCTNRCRKADCSSPSANLVESEDTSSVRPPTGGLERENPTNGTQADECTIYKFPWVITLLWCLGILLLAMIISHCIMCSSLVCRCVKQEVEETEPSLYEGSTDCEDEQYNKRHPFRIDYDNRDIYKTDNNYAPYTLEQAQAKSRRHKHKRDSR